MGGVYRESSCPKLGLGLWPARQGRVGLGLADRARLGLRNTLSAVFQTRTLPSFFYIKSIWFSS